MQAQSTRTDADQAVMTAQHSLQSIQTLLRAGLGCITYLRNLLPADNFSESHLTSSVSDPLSSKPSGSFGSISSDNGQRNVSGFKIMTVTRGFTEEADKLLNFLEQGIFDALEKQYLRSFIFAIYLDDQDPNNIVEAYTFKFNYYKVPGTNVVVPVMSLDEDLMNLSISGRKKADDPVSIAMKNGKAPTLGEVKRSLKALVKNLIQATTQMDALPKRRFATFKLFYHDHTPDDYEPPHFRAGDIGKDKWFFSTHNEDEVPERCSVGSLQTGYHGIDIGVTSVSGYLPSAEDNNAPFLGTTSAHGPTAPPLTPAEEAAIRSEQVAIQRRDAIERRIVWDADDGLGDADAEGEDDPDFAGKNSNDSVTLNSWKVNDSGVDFSAPIGIRNDNGEIIPLPNANIEGEAPLATSMEPAQYAGVEERVPTRIAQLVEKKGFTAEVQVEQTQCIDVTQSGYSPICGRSSAISSPTPSCPTSPSPHARPPRLTSKDIQLSSQTLPPSDANSASLPLTPGLDTEMGTIDTQVLIKDLIENGVGMTDDSEMLDMETQPIDSITSQDDDPIQSFSGTNNISGEVSGRVSTILADVPMSRAGSPDNYILDCECGVSLDDCDLCACDGGCRRWFHTWCMGYHSATDNRMPAMFMCFDCRLKADENWYLIQSRDLYPDMISKYKSLSLFRRAIKVYEKYQPDTLSAFTKKIGCESVVTGQLFKRLEAEDFVALQSAEVDQSGMMETSTRATKSKSASKAKRSRRIVASKPKYVFVRAVTYDDYFNPKREVENRMLGLADLEHSHKSSKRKAPDVNVNVDTNLRAGKNAMEIDNGNERLQTTLKPSTVHVESQTQDETQAYPVLQSDVIGDSNVGAGGQLKRKTYSIGTASASKRVKISVGPAVDLGD